MHSFLQHIGKIPLIMNELVRLGIDVIVSCACELCRALNESLTGAIYSITFDPLYLNPFKYWASSL